jgi:hypothetical protein
VKHRTEISEANEPEGLARAGGKPHVRGRIARGIERDIVSAPDRFFGQKYLANDRVLHPLAPCRIAVAT